jgi:hypothetical protein
MGNRAVVWEPLRAGPPSSHLRGRAVMRTVVLAASLALTAGCAYVLRWPSVEPITQLDPVDYRAKQAEHKLRRELSDEEQGALNETVREELQCRIERYLSSRPQMGDERAYRLRNGLVRPGLTREEVRLLLGEPAEIARDPGQIKRAASKYWPKVRDVADEAWVYPGFLYWDHRYVLYFRNGVLHSMSDFAWDLL